MQKLHHRATKLGFAPRGAKVAGRVEAVEVVDAMFEAGLGGRLPFDLPEDATEKERRDPQMAIKEAAYRTGFSEPSTGSNLGALTCRAVRTDDGWRVTGQKVWTSLAQYSQRCVLLTRTGSPESATKGITALFVDMATPGITVRPIAAIHGRDEFCEVFFDDVVVPGDRLLGAVDDGWTVAMDLLPYERSTSLWHRGAYLRRRLADLIATAPATDTLDAGVVVAEPFGPPRTPVRPSRVCPAGSTGRPRRPVARPEPPRPAPRRSASPRAAAGSTSQRHRGLFRG